MIDLMPLEVRKKKGDFRRALRGYEPELVDDFLDIVADRLEQLVRENAAFRERVKELEHGVAEYRDRERALTDALVTAQEMREEIKSRTTTEAELVRRTAQEEAETRVRDAEQQATSAVRDAEDRADRMLRDAEQRSQALLKDAEHKAETLVREAQQQAETQVREAKERAESLVGGAEQQSEERMRTAFAEAETRLREAEKEAQRLRTDTKRQREREEAALRRLRARQQQLLASYRTFLERELEELQVITETLDLRGEEADGEEPAEAAPESEAERRTRRATGAAAAAFVPLADAIAAEEPEPFEPEPVYEEDLEQPRGGRAEPEAAAEPVLDVVPESGAPTSPPSGWPELEVRPEFRPVPPTVEEEAEPGVSPPPVAASTSVEGAPGEAGEAEDAETEALLENAAKAGYRLELDDEEELLLEEPAAEDEGDDWLGSMIEEKK